MSSPMITKDDLNAIILDGKPDVLVTKADAFGRDLANKRLTKNQIRNVFGEVRKIEAQWSDPEREARDNVRRLLLLKPRMAYQAEREPRAKPLLDVLSEAINLVVREDGPQTQHKRFGYFVEMFEAILAFHTAQEGENQRKRRNNRGRR
ncbi:MAG: type III-A CRISPR-associated protein Csm2 [Chloroflexota bacterium]